MPWRGVCTYAQPPNTHHHGLSAPSRAPPTAALGSAHSGSPQLTSRTAGALDDNFTLLAHDDVLCAKQLAPVAFVGVTQGHTIGQEKPELVGSVRVLLFCLVQGVLVLPKIILVSLPAVVVVEEGIHVLELVGNVGRCLSCPVVVEPLISVVLVFPCFYQLAENAPYSRVKVFCHFLLLTHRTFSATTPRALSPPERLLRPGGSGALAGRCLQVQPLYAYRPPLRPEPRPRGSGGRGRLAAVGKL